METTQLFQWRMAQHGGHYPCVGCDGSIDSSFDLEYMLPRKYKTLDEKRKLILAGPAGRKDTLHPFKNMKVNEIKQELQAKGAQCDGKKEDLQKDLSEILGGTVRHPALLHLGLSIRELNLENYEVLYLEALHCTMNHNKNVLQELQHQITGIETLKGVMQCTTVAFSMVKTTTKSKSIPK